MKYEEVRPTIQIFHEEMTERLSEMSNALLSLEKNPTNKEVIPHLFRISHTIKGNAASALGIVSDLDDDDFSTREKLMDVFSKMEHLTHALENLITIVRDEDLTLDSEAIELFFETEDMLESLTSFIENIDNYENMNITFLSESLNHLHNNSAVTAANTVSISAPTDRAYAKTFILSLECDPLMKHAFTSLVYRDIENLFPHVVFEPDYDYLRSGREFDVKSILLHITDQESPETIIESLRRIDNIVSIAYAPESQSLPSPTAPQTLPEPLDQRRNKIVPSHMSATIKVPTDRIDEVLKHVSNLVILKNNLSTFHATLTTNDDQSLSNLKEIAEQISQTVDYLQESVMRIRMTPLDQLFSRFPKAVRDMARELRKQINFETFGQETEIDKSLLDELPEPLLHMVRNAVYHGIESPEEREAKGKHPIGVVRLSAKHEQGLVVITIEDDGKGIDIEKVVQKAIEKGFITEEKAKTMNDADRIHLVFQQGLSTSENINNIAGRGVGMDVVKSTIERLKGTLKISSEPDQGTKVIIRLPLTLAIIPAMLTRIQEEYYAFPLSSVEEVVMIDTRDIKHVMNREFYILRQEKEIPILRLHEYFQIGSSTHQTFLKLIVLRSGDHYMGVTVDDYVGQEDIVVKNIGRYIGHIPGISGCNILGDGSISLIVDVNTLFQNHADTPLS